MKDPSELTSEECGPAWQAAFRSGPEAYENLFRIVHVELRAAAQDNERDFETLYQVRAALDSLEQAWVRAGAIEVRIRELKRQGKLHV